MSPLGDTVRNTEIAQSAGFSQGTGTGMVVLETDQGPTIPTLIRSLSAYVNVYGPRTTTSATAYDWVSLYFALGGQRLYIIRAFKSNGKKAELTLQDAGSKPTLLVEYATVGTAGNAYKIEVATSGGETVITVLNAEGEALEANPPKKTQAELIEWWATHTTYVTIVASKASEFTTNPPKTLAATKLASGANPSGISEAEKVTSLAGFTSNLGPAQVAIPGVTGETVFQGLGEHALAHAEMRVAWGDLADSSTPATLISGKASLTKNVKGSVMFTSSTAIINGVTPGTTRKVPGSAVAMALCAQVSATGNDNQAPAGIDWPVSPVVLGFTNTFTQVQMEQLVENGINPFCEKQGVLCLNGWVTALLQTEDEIFWSAAASRERMRLSWEALLIREKFDFKTIDGRGQLLAKLERELQGLISRHFEAGALYGENAFDAGSVTVGEPVNTPATEQKGELNATLAVKISEYALSGTLTIISLPLTEPVSG